MDERILYSSRLLHYFSSVNLYILKVSQQYCNVYSQKKINLITFCSALPYHVLLEWWKFSGFLYLKCPKLRKTITKLSKKKVWWLVMTSALQFSIFHESEKGVSLNLMRTKVVTARLHFHTNQTVNIVCRISLPGLCGTLKIFLFEVVLLNDQAAGVK